MVFRGRLAEIAGQYLRKGSQVYVEGASRTRQWTDKDGIERYTTEVNVYNLQMLDPKHADVKTPVAVGSDGMDDDVPF